MDDSWYDELHPHPEHRPPSTSVSSKKPWYFSASTFFCGVLVLAAILLVAWLKTPVLQPRDVTLHGMNLNRVEEALYLNVNLSLHIPVEEAGSKPNVEAICTMLMSSTDNTVLSLSCKSKRVPSPEMLLQKAANWKRAATSWYAIVGYVLLGLLILAGVIWLLFPKTPEVTLENLQLQGLSADAKLPSKDTYYLPKLALDVYLVISLRIRNPNFIGVSYEKITIYVNYNDYQLCNAEVNGDEVAPRGKSTVNANVKVKCAQLLYNAPNLLADAAMQELPVNLVVEFSGYVGSKWFKAPVVVAVSLDAKLDVVSADVVDQDFHLV